MTDLPRYFFGRHPVDGNKGCWVSKPGINVRSTVLADNMLLCPVAKNDQILMRGTVTTPGSGGGVTVNFGLTLPGPPFVFFWYSPFSTINYYPFSPDPSQWNYGETTTCAVFNNRMVFASNITARNVKYIVASRGLP